MIPARDVALVLLAAGSSKRFGREDKLLARLSGKHLIQHCIDRFARIDFGERIAVVRAVSGAARFLSGAGYTLAVNPAPHDGKGRSLAVGVSAIRSSTSCLICLADMPLISEAHIKAMLRVDASVVASNLDGVNQPPVLFDAVHFRALLEAKGENGARDLIQEAKSISAPQAVLADVDVAADIPLISAALEDS